MSHEYHVMSTKNNWRCHIIGKCAQGVYKLSLVCVGSIQPFKIVTCTSHAWNVGIEQVHELRGWYKFPYESMHTQMCEVYTLLELELPQLLAPDLPSNCSLSRGLVIPNCQTKALFIVTTSLSQDWVICAPVTLLGCGSHLSDSLSRIININQCNATVIMHTHHHWMFHIDVIKFAIRNVHFILYHGCHILTNQTAV